jgi:hypothetical protein
LSGGSGACVGEFTIEFLPSVVTGSFSICVVDASPGGFSLKISGTVVPDAGGSAGESTFPRIMGKPSLPLPMISTFEFVECES